VIANQPWIAVERWREGKPMESNMSSSLARDGFEFECDVCGDAWSPPRLGRGSAGRDFRESWELAKSDGWGCFKNAKTTQWWYRCPSCGPAGFVGEAT